MESFLVLRKNIADLLQQRGWSQPELAKRANLDQKTIYNIVSGGKAVSSTKLSTIEHIAEAFGVTIGEILSNRQTDNSVELAEEVAVLIRNYLSSHQEGRKAILRLSDCEAKVTLGFNE